MKGIFQGSRRYLKWRSDSHNLTLRRWGSWKRCMRMLRTDAGNISPGMPICDAGRRTCLLRPGAWLRVRPEYGEVRFIACFPMDLRRLLVGLPIE
jgi:hypothetical protein